MDFGRVRELLIAASLLTKNSEQRGFVYQIAFCKPLQAELVNIYHIGPAGEYQISDDLAGSRSVHHAVAAKAVGQKKTGHAGRWTNDGVMVWRHFVKSCPGPLGIDWDLGERRHAV